MKWVRTLLILKVHLGGFVEFIKSVMLLATNRNYVFEQIFLIQCIVIWPNFMS